MLWATLEELHSQRPLLQNKCTGLLSPGTVPSSWRNVLHASDTQSPKQDSILSSPSLLHCRGTTSLSISFSSKLPRTGITLSLSSSTSAREWFSSAQYGRRPCSK